MVPRVMDSRLVSRNPVRGSIRPPASKSLTQRYFNLALLSGRRLRLERFLRAEDTERWLEALETLGWRVAVDGDSVDLEPGQGAAGGRIHCGAGGTMMRFLVASLNTIPGQWILDGIPRLRERTIAPLVDALLTHGARLTYEGEAGFLPLGVEGGTLEPGTFHLDAGLSSQFLSALLMLAANLQGESRLVVSRLTSAPYVELTLEALGAFGVTVIRRSDGFRLRGGMTPPARLEVEGDWSAACYPATAAVITGGEVRIEGMNPRSAQGDRNFLSVLESMGADLRWDESSLVVGRKAPLRSVDVSLGAMPDQVPTLAAIAPFALGRTIIREVPHLRHKESDRLAAMSRELSALGVPIVERPDGLEIEGIWAREVPQTPEVEVSSWGDHRIAMALALTGLGRGGVRIQEPGVVAKSYPQFWTDLDSLTPH